MKGRGLGRVFQPTYQNKKTGQRKTSAVWWVQYNHRGRTHRESSGSTSRTDAVKLLKRRLGEIGRGKLVGPNEERLTYADLEAGYLTDYQVRGLRSAATARLRARHLRSFFGPDKALDITTDRIRAYQLHRRYESAETATVNRETAALARMFALATKAGRLSARPPFPARLEERAPRQGFFEHTEYLAIRGHLPRDYADVLDFGYHSGWRRQEITRLTWVEVDLAGGVIRLDPVRSKTKTGRLLPLAPPLREVLGRRLAARRLDTSLVFHHNGGQPVGDWRKTWWRACKAAGLPGKLFHDLRRTVARNLIRSGTAERVAMAVTGHKTRSIFDRYNIVSETDLKLATARLAEYVTTQAAISAQVPLTVAEGGAGAMRTGKVLAKSIGLQSTASSLKP